MDICKLKTNSVTNVIDLEAYRQWLSDLDEYASLLAEQYEAIYHEPPEECTEYYAED